MRLLLVEDEDAIRSALDRALRRWGHEVMAAADLATAKALAAERPPDGVISDLKLPDGSGLDGVRLWGVPFILMSGFASFDDAVEALRLGCVDFLTKPVAMQTLQASIGRLGDRCRDWDLCLISLKGGGSSLIRPVPEGFDEQQIAVESLEWTHPEEAYRLFEEIGSQLEGKRERQLLAELMQALPSGRVVVNAAAGWWRAWLAGTVDWQADDGARDRRAVIADLADRIVERDCGMAVECVRTRVGS